MESYDFQPDDHGLREKLFIFSLKFIHNFSSLKYFEGKIRIGFTRKPRFKIFTLNIALGLSDSLIWDEFDWLLISLTVMALDSCSWLYLGIVKRDMLHRKDTIDGLKY